MSIKSNHVFPVSCLSEKPSRLAVSSTRSYDQSQGKVESSASDQSLNDYRLIAIPNVHSVYY